MNLRLAVPRACALSSASLFLALAPGSSASAQAVWLGGASPECVAAIPSSAYRHVPVYIEASVVDSTLNQVLPSADRLTAAVAHLVRSSFEPPTGTDSLPVADGLLHWSRLGSGVNVVVQRDGGFTWSTPGTGRVEVDSMYAPSRMLLAQALSALQNAGMKADWAPAVAGDSFSFRIRYRSPEVRPDGELERFTARFAIPVFEMRMPWVTSTKQLRAPRITYPKETSSRSVEGTVIMEFVVDTAGLAVRESIKDVWPKENPRYEGQMGRFYNLFVAAVRRGIPTARYTPATIAGCPRTELVQQPFVFGFRR